MSRHRYVLVALVLLCGYANALHAQSFTPLGDLDGGNFWSAAYGVSSDGSVVVGTSETDQNGANFAAFRWENGVMVNLGDHLMRGSQARGGVSADGMIIAGESESALPNRQVAVRWVNGMLELLPIPNQSGSAYARPEGISADGTVIVGRHLDSSWSGIKWVNGSPILLTNSPGHEASIAYDVSRDGSVIVGLGGSSTFLDPNAVVWTNGGTSVQNIHPAGWDTSTATAVSADGSVVVGWVRRGVSPNVETRAFRWVDGVLAILEGVQSSASDVSGDGSIMVGVHSSGVGASIWDAENGWRSLFTVLTELDVDMQGWTELSTAWAISDDGLAIVGQGTNPSNQIEGWRATLAGPAADLIVNETTDMDDASDTDDVCDVDLATPGNQCTLRAAIKESNRRDGPNTITFDIDGNGPHTINVATDFDQIVVPVVIDATTQAGYNGTPVVALQGVGNFGFAISAGQTVIRGLSIGGFAIGIINGGQGGNVIEACYIGLDPSGATARPNGIGITVQDTPGHRIGGETMEQRNVISGNTEQGLVVFGTNSTGTVIAGNYVGTDATGAEALGNGTVGIQIIGSPTTMIGGINEGARNVISGNVVAGVEVIGADASSTTILGNYIGVNAIGETPRRSLIGVLVRGTTGLVVGGEPKNVLLGESAAVFVTATEEGIVATNTRIEGNYIGLLASGAMPTDTPQPVGTGVMVGRATGTVIGGAATTPGEAPGNVIGGLNAGVRVLGAAEGPASATRIQGNIIGLNAAGTAERKNTGGVWIEGAAVNTRVGGWEVGERNLIAGNTAFGVAVTEGTGEGGAGEPAGTVVAGNWIGLKADGTILEMSPRTDFAVYVGPSGRFRGLPNAPGGVSDVVIGATEAMAPGSTPAQRRNVIAGSDDANVHIDRKGAPATTPVRVVGNWIGLEADGTGGATASTLGSATIAGVMVTNEALVTVGGPDDARNVIGGNVVGVWIDVDGSEVLGNRIGTDDAGIEQRANFTGVAVTGSNVRVGESLSGEAIPNVISGNILPGSNGNDGNTDGAGVLVGSREAFEDFLGQGGARQSGARRVNRTAQGWSIANLPLSDRLSARNLTRVIGGGELAEDNIVAHNFIGLTVAGDAAVVPNDEVFTSGGVGAIGGASGTRIYGNSISGWGFAMAIQRVTGSTLPSFPVDTRVAGNRMGLTAAGPDTEFVPNREGGIFVGAMEGVVIGDEAVEGQGPNRIAASGLEGSGYPPEFVGAYGILVLHPDVLEDDEPFGIATLKRNLIWANEGLSITRNIQNLGVTQNSAENNDGVASFNFPRLLQVVDEGGGLGVVGTSNGVMDVEVYADSPCDASGHGEGRMYLGTVQAQNGTFEGTVSGAPSASWRIAVTGTNINGTTSEFSPCQSISLPGEVGSLMVGEGETPGLDGPDMTLEVTENLQGAASRLTVGRETAELTGRTGKQVAGVVYVSLHTNAADDGEFDGVATSDDGTTVEPNRVQRQRFWSVRTDSLDGIVHETCLRYDGLISLPVPEQLVLVTRDVRGEAWTPHDSFLHSTSDAAYLCASGLSAFGEFAIGADSLVNPVAIEPGPGQGPGEDGGPDEAVPTTFALSSAYPNPFNPSTVFRLDVPVAGHVVVSVFDMLGRRVAVLQDGNMLAGSHTLRFEAHDLPSGVYVVRAMAEGFRQTRSVTLLK